MRHKYEPITPEIKALITQKLLYTKEMTWEECMKCYGVSHIPFLVIILVSEKKRAIPP